MEGIFNSRDLYIYLHTHITPSTTNTHKLSLYFHATQKNFDSDTYMLTIWLDYIHLLIELNDTDDLKSLFHIIRKGFYKYLRFWKEYCTFVRAYHKDKLNRMLSDSIEYITSKREFDGKQKILLYLQTSLNENNNATNVNNNDKHYDCNKSIGNNEPGNSNFDVQPDKDVVDNTNLEHNKNINVEIANETSNFNVDDDFESNCILSDAQAKHSDNNINIYINNTNEYTKSVTESLNEMIKIGYVNENKNRKPTNKSVNHVYVNNKQLLLLQMIGKGGSSKVYKVQYGNEIYALKIIENITDSNVLENYKNEIQLMMRMKGIEETIELIDYDIERNADSIAGYTDDNYESNSCVYTVKILMEYGDKDLNSIIKDKLTINDTYRIFTDMVNVLKVIYDMRIIHSDIKPGNFVIVKNKIKLIDFGISQEIKQNTTNVIHESKVGTINYMSPESIYADKTSRKSDVWSLGVILYEMLYGYNFMDGCSNYWQKMNYLKSNEPVLFKSKCKYDKYNGVLTENINYSKRKYRRACGISMTDGSLVNNTYDEKVADSNITTRSDNLIKFLIGVCKLCLNKDPNQRPTVTQLIEQINEYNDRILVNKSDIKELLCSVMINNEDVDNIVNIFFDKKRE